MDQFGVPKKVNRHVLKAIYSLNARGIKNPTHAAIMKVVRATMRSNIPHDLPAVVLKSLKSLTKLGLIRKIGLSFSMHHKSEHKEDRKSKLNPNLKRRHISESSSEGDVEKSRRRFSVNRPIARQGQGVELPKVRRSQSYFDVPVDENVYGDTMKENPSKNIKTGQNPRKRRSSDASTSHSASKKNKQLRSRTPAMRKRTQFVPKSPNYSFSDMCLQNAFVGHKIITVKGTGVQTIEYDDNDDIEVDDTQDEMRDSDYESPEPARTNEASCSSSICSHEDEGAAQQVKSVSTSISRDIRDEHSRDNPEVPLENCEHPRNEDEDHAPPLSSEIRTEEEKQCDVKSQHSLRKIYKANNFPKNSDMEIDSNQNEDQHQSIKAPALVTKPNSKQMVQDTPQEEGE